MFCFEPVELTGFLEVNGSLIASPTLHLPPLKSAESGHNPDGLQTRSSKNVDTKG
jgi:hypothetical protein